MDAASHPPVSPSRALNVAVDRAAKLLDTRPAEALVHAEEILTRAPGLPPAELVAAQALRRLGQSDAALSRLAALARRQPNVAALLWELAQAASETGDSAQAIAALERLVRQQAGVASGWFLLARELRKVGRDDQAWRADLSGIHASSRDRDLLEAAVAMNEGRLNDAGRAGHQKRLNS